MFTFRSGGSRAIVVWALSALVIAFLLGSCDGIKVTRLYENGALATSSPIATEIGRQLLTEGANAFDVAVAVGFVLQVVHPQAGNIGGGGFALIRNASSGEIRALDFREKAPGAAHEKMYQDDSGKVIEGSATRGGLACGVPGTVAGLHELWSKYGLLPWDYLVTPAAQLADTGFIIDEFLNESLETHQKNLSEFEETFKIYFPNGRAPKVGERLIQSDLAHTLYSIAAEGRDGFYQGEVADLIIQTVEKHNGVISADDLRQYRPVWREPIHFTFDSLDVYSMPPPSSGGLIVGQILKLLEPNDFSLYQPHSPKYMHLFCESARLAFADRAEHLGDPAFFDVPQYLLSKEYLKGRRELIDIEHATPSEEVSAGRLSTESDQTTHFSISDSSGNMVSLTYTINASYGSGLVVDGAGFLLNNEMDDFSIKPGHANIYGLVGGEANKIESGKRMLSSMSPTVILKDNQPFMLLGSSGGSKIITQVAQAIINITRFGLSPEQTVELARFHHQWLPDKIYLEEDRFDINIKQDLIGLGHNVEEREEYGDLQLILYQNGMMVPASDNRRNGSSGGF